MPDNQIYQPDPASREEIDETLSFVLKAGHGWVLINVSDHVIVNIKHEATKSIFRNERKQKQNR